VVQAAAIRFQDQAGYNATVLAGVHVLHPVAIAAAEPTEITLSDVLSGIGSVIGALVLAFLALYWRCLPLLRRGYEPGTGPTAPIQRFQSGVVNDYVTWGRLRPGGHRRDARPDHPLGSRRVLNPPR